MVIRELFIKNFILKIWTVISDDYKDNLVDPMEWAFYLLNYLAWKSLK